MRARKKHRNIYWYAYVIGLVVYYELAMIVTGFNVTGFLFAFGGIAVITAAFVVFMRRLSRPSTPIITRPAETRPADAEPT